MGWLWFCVIGGVAGIALWRGGIPRALWMYAAAALMLGGAGYAWQAQAGLAGHPVSADSEPVEIDPGLVAFRETIMPGRPGDHLILATADNHLRTGDTGAATRVLLDAIARAPRDAALWTGLGTALAAHDGGQVSPAAGFAFRRAILLDPRAPGPPFFLGMAQVQAGDLARAKTAWLRALALAPRNAQYRIDIAERLVMLDQFAVMSAEAAAGSAEGR